MTRSLKKNPFVSNRLLKKIDKGERRELNPRMVDSQSTALIHLATSAPFLNISKLKKKITTKNCEEITNKLIQKKNTNKVEPLIINRILFLSFSVM